MGLHRLDTAPRQEISLTPTPYIYPIIQPFRFRFRHLDLMRNCFFGGAMHAVLLLQSGHGDQLAADIAGFIIKERQP